MPQSHVKGSETPTLPHAYWQQTEGLILCAGVGFSLPMWLLYPELYGHPYGAGCCQGQHSLALGA